MTVWRVSTGISQLLFCALLLNNIHLSYPVTIRLRNGSCLHRPSKETHTSNLFSKRFSLICMVPKHHKYSPYPFLQICIVYLGIPKASASSSILCRAFFNGVLCMVFSLYSCGKSERGSCKKQKFLSGKLANHSQHMCYKRAPSPYILQIYFKAGVIFL